jgi:MFS superfamily sulfate permease-like transporter
LIFVKSAIPGFILPDLSFAAVSAGIVCVFLLIKRVLKIPDLSAIFIIGSGFFIAFLSTGFPSITFFSVPTLQLPSSSDFFDASVRLIPPQLPLTLTNAILATSLLVHDLFKRDENPDKICKSIGLMSLSSSLFGGFPMCHGAGGLAAHYRFGARGGLSLILGGLVLLLTGVICTDTNFSSALPVGMFGVLLVVVAIELAKHGLKTENLLVSGLIAVISLPFGLALGFGAGLVLAWALRYRNKLI